MFRKCGLVKTNLGEVHHMYYQESISQKSGARETELFFYDDPYGVIAIQGIKVDEVDVTEDVGYTMRELLDNLPRGSAVVKLANVNAILAMRSVEKDDSFVVAVVDKEPVDLSITYTSCSLDEDDDEYQEFMAAAGYSDDEYDEEDDD